MKSTATSLLRARGLPMLKDPLCTHKNIVINKSQETVCASIYLLLCALRPEPYVGVCFSLPLVFCFVLHGDLGEAHRMIKPRIAVVLLLALSAAVAFVLFRPRGEWTSVVGYPTQGVPQQSLPSGNQNILPPAPVSVPQVEPAVPDHSKPDEALVRAPEAVPTPQPVTDDPRRITYAPVNGNVLSQLIPRQYPVAECSDTYSENGFPKFRSTRRAICSKGDAGAAYKQTPWNPGHGNNAGPPSTIELHDVVKQADGSSTVPCELDGNLFHSIANENGGWYDSGMPHILPKLRLRSQQAGDLACTNPIEEPAIFIKREKGGGNNQYHELAQLFTAYFAKHVHGISDNDANAHNLRVIVFDKHDRQQNTPIDTFFYKAFTPHGPETYESLPAGTCFRRAILVYPSTRSIFWIPFGHKPSCSRYPLLEGFQRYILRGTTGSAAVPTPKQRTICYLSRGSGSRQVRGEQEFVAKLREANRGVRIVEGAFGEGSLLSHKSQLEWMSQCTILTGPHGSGLTHLLFLPQEAIVVELHTPGHGSFRGLAKGLGHTFIHLETHDASVGNFPAWARALRSAWHASNNFYHIHEHSELVVPY